LSSIRKLSVTRAFRKKRNAEKSLLGRAGHSFPRGYGGRWTILRERTKRPSRAKKQRAGWRRGDDCVLQREENGKGKRPGEIRIGPKEPYHWKITLT